MNARRTIEALTLVGLLGYSGRPTWADQANTNTARSTTVCVHALFAGFEEGTCSKGLFGKLQSLGVGLSAYYTEFTFSEASSGTLDASQVNVDLQINPPGIRKADIKLSKPLGGTYIKDWWTDRATVHLLGEHRYNVWLRGTVSPEKTDLQIMFISEAAARPRPCQMRYRIVDCKSVTFKR